jgi:hypothetical protein
MMLAEGLTATMLSDDTLNYSDCTGTTGKVHCRALVLYSLPSFRALVLYSLPSVLEI